MQGPGLLRCVGGTHRRVVLKKQPELLLPGLEMLHIWETASSAIAVKGVWLEEQVLEKAQLLLQERDPE